MKIEVIDIRLIDSPGNGLKAFSDIRLDNLIIKDLRIMEHSGKICVEGPYATRRKGGQIFFNPIIIFPEDLKVRLETAVLSAYFEKEEKTHGTQT